MHEHEVRARQAGGHEFGQFPLHFFPQDPFTIEHGVGHGFNSTASGIATQVFYVWSPPSNAWLVLFSAACPILFFGPPGFISSPNSTLRELRLLVFSRPPTLPSPRV